MYNKFLLTLFIYLYIRLHTYVINILYINHIYKKECLVSFVTKIIVRFKSS
jgi:hypothetical protein